ncbi:LysR family transcriptional regulator [Poseidonocella sp. HB161398]|uniref:LysR family transcriptional regulator n=1 Tax=Poseidonocella sp. HB161398 TaxID=2320855 RepID=UPI001486A1AD|nr:LysR family transcriptional regulator [Poseidonocella sp. HB161398]
MKHHQLEAFYQVMLTGSVSQAARNMGRTQPTVSMAIGALETDLQTQLFDRTAGRMRPRAEAVILFERLRPVMEQMEDIRSSFSQMDGIALPQVSIISANNVGTHLIPACIAPLAAPRSPVRLMNGSAARIVADMEGQLRDIAVADEGAGVELAESPLYEVEAFRVPVYALFRKGLAGDPGPVMTAATLRAHAVYSLYREHVVGQRTAHLVGETTFEFQNFFPMACHALNTGAIALVDRITCTTVAALAGRTLDPDWRPLEEKIHALYYLMRPKFRARSEAADACHNAIRAALKAQSDPG